MASIGYSSGACVCYSHPSRWVAFLSTATAKTVRSIVLLYLLIIHAILVLLVKLSISEAAKLKGVSGSTYAEVGN